MIQPFTYHLPYCPHHDGRRKLSSNFNQPLRDGRWPGYSLAGPASYRRLARCTSHSAPGPLRCWLRSIVPLSCIFHLEGDTNPCGPGIHHRTAGQSSNHVATNISKKNHQVIIKTTKNNNFNSMIIHDILQHARFFLSSLSPGPPQRHVGTHPDSDLFARQNVWNGDR